MQQDWIWGLLGGGMIGAAAAIFLLVQVRIMGASGILGGLVDGSAGRQSTENFVFLAGLVLGPAAAALALPGQQTQHRRNFR